MAVIKRFEDFEIWQLSRELSRRNFDIIKNSEKFSKDFSLRDQMKRSAGSVMDNIAEGFGRGGNAEFIYFLSISNGSITEYKSQLYRAFDFEYISKMEFDEIYEMSDKISKKITSFIQYLKKSEIKGEKFKRKNDMLKEPEISYGYNSESNNYTIETTSSLNE